MLSLHHMAGLFSGAGIGLGQGMAVMLVLVIRVTLDDHDLLVHAIFL